MNLLHVVGARPNLMKAAPVVAALDVAGVEQRLIHTGQHYDDALSNVFFRDLGLRQPDQNLGVGSGSHAIQTARLLEALEASFTNQRPSGVVVYGDINSTLASALVAAKLHIPIAHVEAGLRSFDRTMPEEVNRVVTDSLSDVLFTTSAEAAPNLMREGVSEDRIQFVGNPMIDTLDRLRPLLDSDSVMARFGLPRTFGVVTLHRPANVDDPDRLGTIVEALGSIAADIPLVFPVHPRGLAAFEAAGISESPGITATDPLGYLDFVSLCTGASVVITDSGGIQEETTVLGVPCVTVRPNTERPITVTDGTNRLTEPHELVEKVAKAINETVAPVRPPLWDGSAGSRIAAVLAGWPR